MISSGLELSETFGTLLSVGRWIAQAAALVFVVRSYLLQASFYTTIGKKGEEESPLAYILLGIPLYIVLFFWSRARMREEMVLIR